MIRSLYGLHKQAWLFKSFGENVCRNSENSFSGLNDVLSRFLTTSLL
jgi:hypothetical protein